LLREFDVTTVFHLAGGASVPDSVRNPFCDFTSSIPGTVKLVTDLIRHRPSAHVLFVSSAAVYGNPTSLPVSEDAPVAPISPYGIHKATSEFVLQHYARLYDLRVSVLRVFSAFGPGLRKQLFWDLGQRALQATAHGKRRITLEGTGRESRDFIFGTDVANAALHVAYCLGLPGFEVFNIASGSETSIQEAANKLLAYLNLDVECVFNGEVKHGVPSNWRADVTKLNESGFRSEVSFEKGISVLANWFKNECGSAT
jgi:UDP-glucose 4-epimerase